MTERIFENDKCETDEKSDQTNLTKGGNSVSNELLIRTISSNGICTCQVVKNKDR
jgi:hypothetical protein